MKIVPVFNFKDSKSVTIDGYEIDLTKGLSTHKVMSNITNFMKSYLNKGNLNFKVSDGNYSFKLEDIHSVEFIIKGEE